jgi:predicted secreted acid phosphatase
MKEKKAPAKKGKKAKEPKENKMALKVAEMEAEIAALKKEKKKSSKVIVNFNQPEKKSGAALAKKIDEIVI